MATETSDNTLRRVAAAIRERPRASQSVLAELTHLSGSQVSRAVRDLTATGRYGFTCDSCGNHFGRGRGLCVLCEEEGAEPPEIIVEEVPAPESEVVIPEVVERPRRLRLEDAVERDAQQEAGPSHLARRGWEFIERLSELEDGRAEVGRDEVVRAVKAVGRARGRRGLAAACWDLAAVAFRFAQRLEDGPERPVPEAVVADEDSPRVTARRSERRMEPVRSGGSPPRIDPV